MPKSATQTHMTALKNVTATNPVSGLAAMGMIGAEITRRSNLVDKMESIQWDEKRGIGVLMKDAGARQHAANALGLPTEIERFQVERIGTGFARTGPFLGVQVTIWNLEP